MTLMTYESCDPGFFFNFDGLMNSSFVDSKGKVTWMKWKYKHVESWSGVAQNELNHHKAISMKRGWDVSEEETNSFVQLPNR